MRGKIDKKMMIPLIASGIIASQLMGCASASSKEFLDLLNKGEAIEIEVAVPESIEEGTEKDLEWVQLDQLSTYPEFRRAMDDALFITNFGDNSKNGILYVDLGGNHEGNNTLYNAFMNNAFRENYWENEEVQKQVQEAVLEVYADVEAETEGIKVAALNAYYNLLPDAEPNYFNGESLINRGEFMALLYRSENPVQDLESNEEFTALVGESDNTDFAYSLVEDSYLNTVDKSLNTKTFNGTMTRGEAIYMLMHHFYGDELSTYTNSPSLPDIKNGGDIASKQKFTGDYSTSVELMYALQNADSGAPEEIYKAVALAYDKGIINSTEDSRWDEGITKEESLTLLTSTLSSMPTKGSYQQGASTSEATNEDTEGLYGPALEVNPAATTSEVEDEEEEAAIQAEVEAGTLVIPETVEVNELDGTLYTTTDVALREKNTVASEKLATVPAGTAVHVTGITEDEQWYQISDYEDIEVGYISGAYLASKKPSSSSSSSGSTSSSESSSSTSTESESATTSESTSTPAETTQPEPETPAETTPAPETPSTSTGGSTTTAPNPGAQAVYDQVQSGQSSGDTNASRFANIQDGGIISGTGTVEGLHAAD